MTFLGDVFLQRKYNVDVALENMIFNLEYPLSTEGIPAKGKINLGSDAPGNILKTFGKFPVAVNLANNHIMDYGEAAFQKTIAFLESNNIKYFGAGNEHNNFNNPCILDTENRKLALFGYSCPSTHAVFGGDASNGSAKIDVARIADEIQDYTDDHFVIAVFHWGEEEISYPKPTDISIAHQLIDSGVDLIVGHHAHVMQSVEVYKGKHIFYGIGNFIFPDFDMPAYFDGNGFQKRFAKTQQRNNRQSIVVTLDDEMQVDFFTVVDRDGTIVKRSVNVPKWLPGTNYSYNLYKNYHQRKGTLSRFLKNPRFPSVSQVKTFLGMQND